VCGALALLILLLPAAARAGDPEVERRIAEQDAVAARGDTVRLLNEAKAAVKAADTAGLRHDP
jgi:hypothetical protein